MARTLLIVDDIRSNREILKNILGGEYGILEAADGRDAMEVMRRDYRRISAVLLDLGMPVMDGYDVLRAMREDERLALLPVIVTTGQTDSDSEEKALRFGAKDYISKPYKSAIIRQRIGNTIDLRETAATVNALRRDRLTGLFSREAFFEKAAEMVSAHAPGYYIMACFDVDNFKVINDQYGTGKGDEALRHIADTFREGFEPVGGVCCRVMADNFAVLYPASFVDSPMLARIRARAGVVADVVSPLTFSIGRYIVDDLTLSPSAMYDRASLAEGTVKGRYDRNIALYDESMRAQMLGTQQVVTEMVGALKSRQFEAWFQPQYNHTTGALIGAEALARWRHPERGMISPAAFIPVFEKNGFIYELDKYIWEEACRLLRKWLDEARAPLPVSVNISRYDIFCPDLLDTLKGLTDKYRVPVSLLRLEITESAFAESTEQIVRIVRALIECGFTVEIDDFGSGYSSLNTLKNVPAQVVKLDMRFLESGDGSRRGGNILESIVRMTKWLGMSVIAEGVENKKQADFLKSIGCSYVQGFLYARPMPEAEYEALCAGADGREERLLTIDTVENLDNDAFWDPASMDTLIFNSYVGAACIFEYFQHTAEILRANDKFADVLGGKSITVEDTLKLDWLRCLTPQSRARVREALARSGESGEEVCAEYELTELPGGAPRTYLRATMRVIASVGDRKLVYCMCENITAQRVAERSERRLMKQMQAIMDNVNCGITAVTMRGESVIYLLANDRYFDMLGYTREQYQTEVGDRALITVHPEDKPRVIEALRRIDEAGAPTQLELRAIRRDGDVIWLRCSMSITSFEGVAGRVQLSTYTDVTSEKLAEQELLDNLPNGAALYEYDGRTLTAVHLNKRYWELVDRAPVRYEDLSVIAPVHPDDRAIITGEIASAVAQGRDAACDIRIRCGGNEYRPFHMVGRIVARSDGRYVIYASYSPISGEVMSVQRMLPIALRTMMDTQTGFSFVKDKNLRYVCCSRAVYEAAGLRCEEELVGRTDYELVDRATAERYVAADRRVMEKGEPVIEDVDKLPSADGAERYSSTSKFPLRDATGDIVGIYGVGRDITETRAMKSQLELLANNIPGGIAIYAGRPDALDKIRLVYFNDGFCRLFGCSREAYGRLATVNPMGLVAPDDMPALMEQVVSLVRDGVPLDCVYRVRTVDGGHKWINVRAVRGDKHGDDMTVNAVLLDVTQRQEAIERLHVSEEENRLAMAHSRNVVCRYDVAARSLRVSPSVNPIFGVKNEMLEDVPYGQVRGGDVSPETAATYTSFYEDILRGEKSGSMVYQRRSTAGWRWVEAHFSTIFSGAGKPVSAVISFSDITDRLEKEAAYKRWQQSLHEKDPASYSLFRCNVSKKASFDEEEGALLSVRFEKGAFRFDEHTAQYARQCVAEEDRARFSAFLNADALLADFYQGKRVVSLEYREALPGGGERWLRLTVDLVETTQSSEVEAYLLFENIDAAKRAEMLTIARAENDPLTGVMNRVTFAARMDAALRAARPGALYALLMLDIDGFKLVNDVFGHGAGDQALVDIANMLRSALRRDDLVGRLGGDEFVVFLPDIPDDSAVANKARQICAMLRRSFSVEVEISASVGITVAPRDGVDFETMYGKADAALYHVKGSGKDGYAFFREDMADEHLEMPNESGEGAEKKRRMLIVDDSRIDHAMLAGMFSNEFIVEKAKDGASALIRLRHYGMAISVVLLDLVMPGMDGFAVLDKMRQSAELRGIPVVVVSGDGNRETSLRAIRAGASDYVTKPVDPDELRIRVFSAISKAENERLRAKNSVLEYLSSEAARYRTVLQREATAVIEHDWINNSFVYDAYTSVALAGVYDGRGLWRILLSDMVADTATVKAMQELTHDVATDKLRAEGGASVRLKTPSQTYHWFRMRVYKAANEFGLTGKVYISLHDTTADSPEE